MKKNTLSFSLLTTILFQILLAIYPAQAETRIVAEKTKNNMYFICLADGNEVEPMVISSIWPDAHGGFYFYGMRELLPLHWDEENMVQQDPFFNEEVWLSEFSQQMLRNATKTLFYADGWYAVDYSNQEVLCFRGNEWELLFPFEKTGLDRFRVLEISDGKLYCWHAKENEERTGFAAIDLATGIIQKSIVLPLNGGVMSFVSGTILMYDDEEIYTLDLDTETQESFVPFTDDIGEFIYDQKLDRLYYSNGRGDFYLCDRGEAPQLIRSFGLPIYRFYLLSDGRLALIASGHNSNYGIFIIDPIPLKKQPKVIESMDQKHDIASLRYILEHPEIEKICLGHSNEFPSRPIVEPREKE